MRHWTDDEFARAGWVWVLRKHDSDIALACTVDGSDADKWRGEGRGYVVNVRSAEWEGTILASGNFRK